MPKPQTHTDGTTSRVDRRSKVSSRPAKKRRTESVGFGAAPEPRRHPSSSGSPTENTPDDDVAAAAAVPAQIVHRSRALTACSRCRARKSRCDSKRPNCSNCSKVQVTCVYEEETSSTCHIVGPQLLDAIGNLTDLLQRQQHESSLHLSQLYQLPTQDAFSPNSVPSFASAQSPLAQFAQQQPQRLSQNRSNHQSSESSFPPDEERPLQGRGPVQHPQGLDSVLKWNVYSSKMTFPDRIGAKNQDVATTHQLPCLEYSDLARLEMKYIDGVHIKNPILDLTQLHRMILHVSENGLDWSTETCLVAMVCAIGAISGRYNEALPTGDVLSPTGIQFRPIEIAESEPELAVRHWNVAAKRLGYAISQDSIEAVQCLCLAGVWYMHQMQPLQAWKYFSLAGIAWYGAILKNLPPPASTQGLAEHKLLSLEQSLYFTIYKSDCELHLELDLPTSILEDINLSKTFPLPPPLDSHLSDSEFDITQRGWYYYLAEIAARHLINRLLHARSGTRFDAAKAGNSEIRRMLAEVGLFETQLLEWYSSLPPMLTFDVPQGHAIKPHSDDLIQILRNRYLSINELIYRPFVRLCVENPLGGLEWDLRDAVAALASKGLLSCMYKLTQLSPQRHQGTWFMMRNHATNALILNAANIARKDITRQGAARMIMPEGWRERITDMRNILELYWNDDSGDVAEIRKVVEWAMSVAD